MTALAGFTILPPATTYGRIWRASPMPPPSIYLGGPGGYLFCKNISAVPVRLHVAHSEILIKPEAGVMLVDQPAAVLSTDRGKVLVSSIRFEDLGSETFETNP
jgi:hypothetical protein